MHARTTTRTAPRPMHALMCCSARWISGRGMTPLACTNPSAKNACSCSVLLQRQHREHTEYRVSAMPRLVIVVNVTHITRYPHNAVRTGTLATCADLSAWVGLKVGSRLPHPPRLPQPDVVLLDVPLRISSNSAASAAHRRSWLMLAWMRTCDEIKSKP